MPTIASEREDALALLEAAAADLPRGIAGIPAQWFEMNSAIGWEKMMLVFGYADNRTACNNMMELAYAETTERDFRCTPAN
ncbi:hypothetical protein [Meridianimarinicoccus zhengii]|uniref:hypothetical protein n=1 Tax=Meridianimarinicoccus zhengii TaxID=2056810 RepID=UPI0013A6D3BA|nr:hypothetical protein [Phycocomes zhengii]